MVTLLHRFFEKLEKLFNDKFLLHIVKVSEMKGCPDKETRTQDIE